MIVTEILISIFVLMILKYLWEKRKFFYFARKIPYNDFYSSPKTLMELITCDTKVLFRLIVNALKKSNGLEKTWIGPLLFVTVNIMEIY